MYVQIHKDSPLCFSPSPPRPPNIFLSFDLVLNFHLALVRAPWRMHQTWSVPHMQPGTVSRPPLRCGRKQRERSGGRSQVLPHVAVVISSFTVQFLLRNLFLQSWKMPESSSLGFCFWYLEHRNQQILIKSVLRIGAGNFGGSLQLQKEGRRCRISTFFRYRKCIYMWKIICFFLCCIWLLPIDGFDCKSSWYCWYLP